jgi:hypothetical protein
MQSSKGQNLIQYPHRPNPDQEEEEGDREEGDREEDNIYVWIKDTNLRRKNNN